MAFFGRPSADDEARAASWRAWARRQDPLAIVSLVLGAFSLTHGGTLLVDALAALGAGTVALRRIARARADVAGLRTGAEAEASGEAKTAGRALAWTGILCGALSLVVAAWLYRWIPGG